MLFSNADSREQINTCGDKHIFMDSKETLNSEFKHGESYYSSSYSCNSRDPPLAALQSLHMLQFYKITKIL